MSTDALDIATAALIAREKMRASELAYGYRRKTRDQLDSSDTRNRNYLAAFDANQKADRERDAAMDALWAACDGYNEAITTEIDAGELAAIGAPE